METGRPLDSHGYHSRKALQVAPLLPAQSLEGGSLVDLVRTTEIP